MNFAWIPSTARMAMVLTALLALQACTSIGQYSNAAFNEQLLPAQTESKPAAGLRSTYSVDGKRGNPKVLMFLSLSGGGSRSSYLSMRTMLALQELNLLGEVDVISAVSGGSLAAAYYVASRDVELIDPRLRTRVESLPAALAGRLQQRSSGGLVCSSAFTPAEESALRTALADPQDALRLVELCRAGQFPPWTDKAALGTMKKNFMLRYVRHLLMPQNLWRYWHSAFDRSDIMAGTLATSALGKRGLGNLLGPDLLMNELNPLRPYLLISATNATRQIRTDGNDDEFPFGSIFSFTHEDFQSRLASDIRSYRLANAVMASSAFPLAFATVTLEDYSRPPGRPSDAPERENKDRRFLHLIDGGNSDNLGLRSVKRALLELHAADQLKNYDRIVVLQVDAFATPAGTGRHKPDPRGLLDLLVDTNVSHAVDSLLQSNRDRLLGDFDGAVLNYDRECGRVSNAIRHFPTSTCNRLHGRDLSLDLRDKLVFFHFGFADVVATDDDRCGRELKKQLDLISTGFSIDDDEHRRVSIFGEDNEEPDNQSLPPAGQPGRCFTDRDNPAGGPYIATTGGYAEDGYEIVRHVSATRLIDEAVRLVIQPQHRCIGPLAALIKTGSSTPQEVRRVRCECLKADRRNGGPASLGECAALTDSRAAPPGQPEQATVLSRNR